MKTMGNEPARPETEWMVVFAEVPRERMCAYVNECLGELLAAKGYERNELLFTLETFVDCGGEINKLARRLYIHRNTATYRIGKLERQLGMPLKDPGILLRLKLAFLFRRILSDVR